MYAFAVMIGSLVVGKLLTLLGRKFILIFGLTMMGLSMLAFGFITYIDSHIILITKEWFLVGIKLKKFNSLKKFLASPFCFQLLKVSQVFLLFSFSESLSESSVLRLYPRICKKTESNFSITHSPCRQRKKPFGTGYSSFNSGIMVQSNKMGRRIVGVTSS